MTFEDKARRFAWLGGWLLAGVAGCEMQSPTCAETVRELASLDDVSSLGLSGEDVLRPFSAGREVELRWHENVRDPVGVTFTPSGSVTTLRIEVAYEDGGVFDVDARVESPRGPRSNEAISCRSRVEVAARLSAQSVDGGLDESWPDLIVVREGPPERGEPVSDESTIVMPFTLENLGGSLTVDAIEPPPEAVRYELRVRGSDDGELVGKIVGLATYSNGASSFELASFGTSFMTEGPEP